MNRLIFALVATVSLLLGAYFLLVMVSCARP
jgi:hypothetical protein